MIIHVSIIRNVDCKISYKQMLYNFKLCLPIFGSNFFFNQFSSNINCSLSVHQLNQFRSPTIIYLIIESCILKNYENDLHTYSVYDESINWFRQYARVLLIKVVGSREVHNMKENVQVNCAFLNGTSNSLCSNSIIMNVIRWTKSNISLKRRTLSLRQMCLSTFILRTLSKCSRNNKFKQSI